MDKEAILKKVKSKTKEGKISCKQALKISEEEGISSKEAGRAFERTQNQSSQLPTGLLSIRDRAFMP